MKLVFRICCFSAFFACALSHETVAQVDRAIRFEKQVLPILSNHCWNCHGRDEASRQANLRLDLPADALKPTESGVIPVVPGHPEKSELIARIESHDLDLQMPPRSAKKPLTDEQKEILRQWIADGAEYSGHWAFQPPERPLPPTVRQSDWPKNSIDNFVLQRLEQEQLQPSREVEPNVWLRRVSLDLTGLPPSIDELQEFELQRKSMSPEQVYSDVVDRLLSSPRHGERMAMHWLDAARYADTNGYNNDETRTMWPWRDWVIRAFASGMPYDQFLTEQLAGDLLPNATLSQKVATGFNRNHVLTTEGGIIEEEYHVEYVADRVHTTATVFLGLSMQCARCHDHKYDPISQREFYQFASFFNNIPDKVVSYNNARMAEPLLKVPSPAQQAELDRIASRTAEIQDLLRAILENIDSDISEWEKTLTADQIADAGRIGRVAYFTLDESEGDVVRDQVVPDRVGKIVGTVNRVNGRFGQALSFDGSTFIDAAQVGAFESTEPFSVAAWIQLTSNDPSTVLSKIDEANSYRGYDLIMESGRVAAHFVHSWPDKAFKVVSKTPISLNEWHHVAVTYDGSRRAAGVRIYVDGSLQDIEATTDNELSGTLKTDKAFHIGQRQNSAPFRGQIDDVQLYQDQLSANDVAAISNGTSTGQLAEILLLVPTDRTPAQHEQLKNYYLAQVDPTSKKLQEELNGLPKLREEIEKDIPATMVMSEPKEPRPAFILKRGQYDQRGEQVESGLPQVLNVFAPSAVPETPVAMTRLDLANWLTDPRHPLTARVAVNRWWEMLFGMGLVETAEDFGVQGALPSHPELLDWLATELIQQQQWNQKAILKLIVMSATYRQESRVTPELLERDPRNQLLSRGSRYRLPAETVRDNALFVSGLLKEQFGGPSVRPYQPEGLWEDVSVERRDKYVPDSGDGLYRRSMYTFWKRTCPPPGMATFDAPDREFCLIRRARTNTPLQALVLLNDPTYVEAARKLAESCLLSEGSDEKKLALAFQRVLCRLPDPAETSAMRNIMEAASLHFQQEPAAAEELLSVGSSPRDMNLSSMELAAWTTAMSVLLNLDETITKP